ncbi:MAG: response regulator transcription factor [Deltaproteobacteria bacterium]|nr:MAG: response regulator transcription factor [Deltaproteobacteria bacterium]
MRILVCDDHPIVRRGLREILEQAGAPVTVGEAASAAEGLALARKQSWDTVVLDITMPGRSGLELLKELKSERPHVPVLVLSVHPAEQYAVRVLRAGASGYLTKESAPEELLTAIRHIVRGGRYISPSVGETLADDLGRPAEQLPHHGLSDREFEIMRRLASGKRVSEIADQLHLSVKTVSTYRARVLGKLNLRTTAEIMRYALKHGLVD